MKFADLLQLPTDPRTGVIDPIAVSIAQPNIPEQVAKQFLSEHGRKQDFQVQYGSLDLDAITWRRATEIASRLIECSYYFEFERWFENVKSRPEAFASKGWKCIDSRSNVREHWERFGTWLLPPIFLQGELVRTKANYHLAEGHTRVGLLAGLVHRSIVLPDSTHEIWLGTA